MLTSDFKEFVALLHSNGVEYLVVGGYALAAFGHPRQKREDGVIGGTRESGKPSLSLSGAVPYSSLAVASISGSGIDRITLTPTVW